VAVAWVSGAVPRVGAAPESFGAIAGAILGAAPAAFAETVGRIREPVSAAPAANFGIAANADVSAAAVRASSHATE